MIHYRFILTDTLFYFKDNFLHTFVLEIVHSVLKYSVDKGGNMIVIDRIFS